MTYLVDTSVWSLALRRDKVEPSPAADELRRALVAGETVVTTGIILQEILQGAVRTATKVAIVAHFAPLPHVVPTVDDHIAAANVRNACRKAGVQIGTVDALLVQLCLARDLTMLTVDRDFHHASTIVDLRVWQ